MDYEELQVLYLDTYFVEIIPSTRTGKVPLQSPPLVSYWWHMKTLYEDVLDAKETHREGLDDYADKLRGELNAVSKLIVRYQTISK